MQIIIPMTGYGSRFVAAGYKELKPFIKVLNRPIIEWIVRKMYPNEKNILYICRKEHLDADCTIKNMLLSICPTAKIVAIKDWEKKGPVYDIIKASEFIDDNNEVIINYCDFYMSWNWENFKKDVQRRQCDGCIPCYSGFHPHLIHKNNLYASCLVDKNDNLLEIREKFSFEDDKTKARHSPGVYYFKNGAIMKKYCKELIKANNSLNGEFYASLPYNYMVRDGKKVWVPVNVEYFCQWGTPEDMEEFNYWIGIIKKIYDKGDQE